MDFRLMKVIKKSFKLNNSVNAIVCTRIAKQEYNLIIDYHVFSDLLDNLANSNWLDYNGCDNSGMMTYRLTK